MFEIISVTGVFTLLLGAMSIADRVGKSRAAAEAEDAALLARAAAPPTDRDRRCPRCHGQHCVYWLQDGAPCPPQRAPGLSDILIGPGLHEPTAAYRRIVPASWRPPRPAWSTLTQRVGALPRIGVLP